MLPDLGLGPHRHWQVSSHHHQTCTLDYSYLLGLLEDMQAHWEEAASLPQDQVSICTATGLPGIGEGYAGVTPALGEREGQIPALRLNTNDWREHTCYAVWRVGYVGVTWGRRPWISALR